MKKQLFGGYSIKETKHILQGLRDENAAMHLEYEKVKTESVNQLAELAEQIDRLEAEKQALCAERSALRQELEKIRAEAAEQFAVKDEQLSLPEVNK